MESEERKKAVKKAMKGDKESFTKLYGEIYVDMYRFACFMIGNVQDAEDAVADAVVDMYLEIKKLRNPEKYKSWAFAILANKCRRKIGTMKNRPLSYEEGLPDVFERENVDNDINIDVKTAFMELTKEERLIISYHVFAGYSSDEIGEKLHMNSNTVRSKMSRAMGKMRAKMEVV